MVVSNQHLPLVGRQTVVADAPIGLLTPAASAVNVGTGVPRIVQRIGGTPQGERPPRQLTLAWAASQPGWKEQSFFPEVFDGGTHGARSGVRCEE